MTSMDVEGAGQWHSRCCGSPYPKIPSRLFWLVLSRFSSLALGYILARWMTDAISLAALIVALRRNRTMQMDLSEHKPKSVLELPESSYGEMPRALAAQCGRCRLGYARPLTLPGQYYASLIHQQNMLQDTVRTAAYHDAIVQNAVDFHDKVVLDVGTGSGILAYFAIKAGARKVYAVEASDVADRAKLLMQAAGLSDRVIVFKCKVEHLVLEEKVDIIISE